MGRSKPRIPKRDSWANWNGGIIPMSLWDEMSPGRAPAFCLDCDAWFTYEWGMRSRHVKHPGCGRDCTFAY